MSERELGRIEVLSCVVEKRMSVTHAAEVLGLGPRQVQRLLRTFRVEGAPALRHKARGRPSNNRIRDGVRDLALALVRESYADFGPTLAAEKLGERHGLKVSRETLRKWMAEDGLWLSRRQRRTFHQPRLRRERLGELVQIDGSDHRWFEDRAPACTLRRAGVHWREHGSEQWEPVSRCAPDFRTSQAADPQLARRRRRSHGCR